MPCTEIHLHANEQNSTGSQKPVQNALECKRSSFFKGKHLPCILIHFYAIWIHLECIRRTYRMHTTPQQAQICTPEEWMCTDAHNLHKIARECPWRVPRECTEMCGAKTYQFCSPKVTYSEQTEHSTAAVRSVVSYVARDVCWRSFKVLLIKILGNARCQKFSGTIKVS